MKVLEVVEAHRCTIVFVLQDDGTYKARLQFAGGRVVDTFDDDLSRLKLQAFMIAQTELKPEDI